MELNKLLVPNKEITTEYPGFPDFMVTISFLSREVLQKLRKKCTKTMTRRGRTEEEFNDNLFLQLYVKETIKGWTGLKLKYVQELAPVNLEGQDLEAELDYTEENALELIRASGDFDKFISDFTQDLGNFNKPN